MLSSSPRRASSVARDGGLAAVEPLLHGPEPRFIEARDGTLIAVRELGIEPAGTPLIVLHGLESHSQWFLASARRIASCGLSVYAYDRRGSGCSPCSRPQGRLADLLAELDAVVDHASSGRPQQKVHLLGHCFGALLALLYAGLHRPGRVASLVLATPALYTRSDLGLFDKLRVLGTVFGRGDTIDIPLPFAPEDLSELAPFVSFIKADPRARHSAPARLFYDIHGARRDLPRAVASLRAPLFVALAGDDPICDNRRTLKLFTAVPGTKELREYLGARHILDFSGARERFLADLVAWYQREEARRCLGS